MEPSFSIELLNMTRTLSFVLNQISDKVVPKYLLSFVRI